MSRRKIRTRPKIKKPHFFEKDEWMRFRDARSKSKRKKTDTSPTLVEEDETEEKEYIIPAPEKETNDE